MPNNLDNFIPEIWSSRIIQNLDQVNVAMAVMANTNYEGEIRNAGDTVHVRTFGSITVSPYSRGQAISYEDLAPDKETLTINESKMFAFKVDDLDRAQNDINALDGYTRRAGVALANTIDAKLLGYYASTNSSNRVTNGGSAITVSAANAYTTLVDAGKVLDDQGVPGEGRWAIITPTYKAFLLKDTTYLIRATALGDAVIRSGRPGETATQAMQRGFFGQIANFDLYVSTAVPTDSTGRYVQFGQGKPVSYAAQIPPGTLEALRLESTFATAVRGLLLHDGKVFNEDAKRFGYILIGATQ